MVILLYIGLGGFAGAILRFLVSGAVQDWSKSSSFPFGTLAVNVLGCFTIGLLTYLVDYRGLFSPETRMGVLTGILGAFTTFSTFGYETLAQLQDGEFGLAAANILLNNGIGLAAVWLGRLAAQIVWR